MPSILLPKCMSFSFGHNIVIFYQIFLCIKDFHGCKSFLAYHLWLISNSCDNVLPHQVYSMPQECGTMVESDETGRKPYSAVTSLIRNLMWRHTGLNPRLCSEETASNYISYGTVFSIWIKHFWHFWPVKLTLGLEWAKQPSLGRWWWW
jgi:hypothetical protein